MAFRFDRLTLKSQEAVQKAQSLARDRGHQRLEPMHLLAALADPEQQVIRTLARSAWRQSRPGPQSRRGRSQLPCPRSPAASRSLGPIFGRARTRPRPRPTA